MWTSQDYGHHDKMARTKTNKTSQNTEYTKTHRTLRKKLFFVFYEQDTCSKFIYDFYCTVIRSFLAFS